MARSQKPQTNKQPNKKQALKSQKSALQLNLFSQGLTKHFQSWPHQDQFLYQPPFTKSVKLGVVGLTGAAVIFL